MKLRMMSVVILAAMVSVPAIGADKEAKKKKGEKAGGRQNAAAQILKQFESVGLTEDQTKKITELGKTVGAEMKKIRDDAGITPEIIKKRAEAGKSMKDSGKKGKDLQAAINEAAGLTAAQVSAMGKLNEVRAKFQKDVVAMLSDEQKAKLPARLQKGAGGIKGKGGEKGKAKAKKDAA